VRIAFIADVHANMIAFEAVLNEIDRLDIERIICAGDAVGYYPYPNETIELLRSRGILSILGNHDRAVIRINPVGMNRIAAEAVLWTAKYIKAENVDYLKELKSKLRIEIDSIPIGIYHGSPRDDDEYLYEVDASGELLEMCDCRMLVVGHTHIPFVKRLRDGMVLNPGSVGQPRDGDPRASFLTLDSESETTEIRKVEYDIASVERKVTEAGLPQFLGERLRYGF